MLRCECPRCGAEFWEEDARRITDNYFGKGRYDWICNFLGLKLCADCAESELSLEDEYGNEVPPENVIYPELDT